MHLVLQDFGLFDPSVGALFMPDVILECQTAPAGKRAFIAGIADDQGFGWAIAKALAAAGAEILVGTWVPVGPFEAWTRLNLKLASIQCSNQTEHGVLQALNIFETSLRRGKFDESRVYVDLIPSSCCAQVAAVLDLGGILLDLPLPVPGCRLPTGSLLEIAKVYPLDAVYDAPEDVPDDV